MYNGFLLKIGDYVVPLSILRPESYSPYVNMQDFEPWTDSNGYIHREPVDLKAAKVEFETVAMLSNTDFSTFMHNIRSQYTIEIGRQFVFTAYIPEYDDYVTQTGYLADFQPTIYFADDSQILYNPIKFSVIGGVYNG